MNQINPESILVNEHIQLKPPTKEYSRALYNVISFNQDYFSQFMAWPKFVTHEIDTAKFLDNCLVEHQKDLTKS